MKHSLLVSIAAVLAFTACTQDETGTLPDGTQSLKLTAAIEGSTATRASVDNYWDVDDNIALKVEGDNAIYTYTVEDIWGNMSGNYYWKSTGSIMVQGFYPFKAAAATEWEVKSQQDTEINYQGGDLLVSQKEQIAFGNNASLTFYHQTAKVVVNVEAKGLLFEGWEDATITLDIGSDLTLNGTFTPPTEADANGRWIGKWIPGSKKDNITPCEVDPSNYAVATYEALVIPQDVSAGTQLLTFNVTKDGIHYGPFRYTLENGITWKPGYEYTYDITLFHYGLEVLVTESIEWSTNNTGNGNLSLEDGYDEATETYYAYTADGLKDWAEKVKSGEIGLNAKCLLFDDIDFGGEEWTPVGSSDNGFIGTFDGQGHTISNMTIANSEYAGLFAYIEKGGRVQNVEFKNIEISPSTADGYTGIVAGRNEGTIYHCQIVDGEIMTTVATQRVGGIAGQNDGTISFCEVTDCIVYSTSGIAGGIVGENSLEGEIVACSFTDMIYAGTYGGGIVGQNSGDIRACWADATFAGNSNYKGGVCGDLLDGKIVACYWSGNATAGCGQNLSGSPDDTNKVNNNWDDAATIMNDDIEYLFGQELGWHWQTDNGNTPPTLVQR